MLNNARNKIDSIIPYTLCNYAKISVAFKFSTAEIRSVIDQRLAWGKRGIRASETNIDYGAKLLLVGAK